MAEIPTAYKVAWGVIALYGEDSSPPGVWAGAEVVEEYLNVFRREVESALDAYRDEVDPTNMHWEALHDFRQRLGLNALVDAEQGKGDADAD